MKINGLKKAIGEYKQLNAGGPYSPHYGRLMFDKSNGEIWTDEFYSLGHNNWKEYASDAIINLGAMMADDLIEVNMRNVKLYIVSHFSGFEA